MYQRNSSRKLRHRLLSSLLLIGFFGTILSVWAYYSYFVDVGEKGVNEVNSVLVSEHFNVFEPVLPDRTVSLPRDFQFHPEFQHEEPRHRLCAWRDAGPCGSVHSSPGDHT